MWYMKRCRDCLEQIRMLPGDQGAAFLRLKKKAQKYLKRAQEFEKSKNTEAKEEVPPASQSEGV